MAGTATVITSEELEVYEYTDIHKILASVPGVNFRPEEGYGLRPNVSIRGTYADRSGKITLMEDGVLIAPGPYSSSSAYYFPTVGRLAGVEVLKGAAAITQGPYTIGGAINLLSTPIPEEQSGFFNQEFGQDGAQRTHATYGNSSENFGFLLAALAILNGDNDTPVKVKLKHNNREYESDGLDLRLNWSNDIHSVTVGYRDTEDSEDRFQHYEYSQWSGGKMGALTVGPPPGYSSNNRLTEADAEAFYIQDVITLENLTLNIGYRSEDWSITQERYVDSARSAINTEKGYPKTLASDDASLFGLGAVYDISDEISLYAGFNEGFTPTSGGADPEEAENTEVGVRYSSGATYIDVGYFATDY